MRKCSARRSAGGDAGQLDDGVVVRHVAMRAAVGVEHDLRRIAALHEVDVALADRLLRGRAGEVGLADREWIETSSEVVVVLRSCRNR
jgi:hypothetical protein